MSRAGLLVSVRSAAEARAALAGGADLIDVKEPDRGPLGRADDQTIFEIVDAVAGRAPVSAALGEWRDNQAESIPDQLRYVKWGLAGCRADWTRAVAELARVGPAAPVLVAYADSEAADSPPPDQLVDAACRHRFAAFLIDTTTKDGRTLLDWLPESTLMTFRDRLRAADVRLALAGSLDAPTIRCMAAVEPDWFAVRGAACVGGRGGTVCAERVRELRSVIEHGG
ncbi:MAG TPA: (5-formylfuran-3-yl)methyl phosphate synthase [Gemmataceae bacterium]|jgi:uncharacterized protein (UPF0264 family)|nr:(5-formylfuran-3-yl)methyl phosphate synthase [Gemmataceae bacterium]